LKITDGLTLQALIHALEHRTGKKVHAVGFFDGGVVDLELMSPTGLRGVSFSKIDGRWKSEYISIYNRDLGFAVEK
jgi:hypothetical protein